MVGRAAEVGSMEPGRGRADGPAAALCGSPQLVGVFQSQGLTFALRKPKQGHTLPLPLWQGTETELAKGRRHRGSASCYPRREAFF